MGDTNILMGWHVMSWSPNSGAGSGEAEWRNVTDTFLSALAMAMTFGYPWPFGRPGVDYVLIKHMEIHQEHMNVTVHGGVQQQYLPLERSVRVDFILLW